MSEQAAVAGRRFDLAPEAVNLLQGVPYKTD